MPSIAPIFAGGESGAAFDSSVLSTVWQDSARTTPWASSGDPVGALDSVAGTITSVTQATAGNRPTQNINSGNYDMVLDGSGDRFANVTVVFGSPGESCWFGYLNYAALSAYHNIIEESSTGLSGMHIWIDTANKIENNFTNGVTSASAYSGTLYRVVIRAKTGSQIITINGSNTDTATKTFTHFTGSKTVTLFNRAGGSTLNGTIRSRWGFVARFPTDTEVTDTIDPWLQFGDGGQPTMRRLSQVNWTRPVGVGQEGVTVAKRWARPLWVRGVEVKNGVLV